MSEASQAIADTPILRPPSIRCRSLTLSGRQCRASALRGYDLCIRHAENRYPVLPRGADITLPLLEDLESVQIFITQIAQGLLSQSIDTSHAGKLLYACQIATHTMPRPARLLPLKEEAPSEPVTQVFSGPDGHLIGPVEDARGQARFDESWSYDKFRYEQECEKLGHPLPQTPADMPQSGWLNPEDLDRISHQRFVDGRYVLDDGYLDKILQLRLEADRRDALPPIADRRCAYGNDRSCAGPGPHGACYVPCEFCAQELEQYLSLHPGVVLPITGIHACADDSWPPHVKSVNTANIPESSHLRRQ